jgi:hypothetical protein
MGSLETKRVRDRERRSDHRCLIFSPPAPHGNFNIRERGIRVSTLSSLHEKREEFMRPAQNSCSSAKIKQRWRS